MRSQSRTEREDAGCRLCDLPTPDPPVTGEGVEGDFCCRGCLEVARSLDERDVDSVDELADGDGDGGRGAFEDLPPAAEECFFSVDGMHCGTCETFLESRAGELPGVHAVEASYPTELLRVAFDPDRFGPTDLADRLSVAGYDARPLEDPGEAGRDGDDRTGRLLVGGFFGMMVMLWYVLFLYPQYLGLPERFLLLDPTSPVGAYLFGNVWVLSTVVLLYTGGPILQGALVSLRAGEPNMDLLVGLAAVTAHVYSTAGLLLGRTELYFDVAVVIVLAVTLGSYYERRVRRRAVGRLADAAAERVETARVRRDERVDTVPIEEVTEGTSVVVDAGERVPVDGTVREGSAAVDESLVTGESVPVSKATGDDVLGGTAVAEGRLVVEADGGRGTIDRLLGRLWAAKTARPAVQRLADRVAAVFVPFVLVLAVVATAWRLLSGIGTVEALLAGLAVLVVSCPCALGLATPLAVARAITEALEEGIVLSDASVVEHAPDADVVVLDKTGTLTTGEMRLVEAVGDEEALARAAAVERGGSHPMAEAVVDGLDVDERVGNRNASAIEIHPGRGVSGDVDGDRVTVGRADLFEGATVPGRFERVYEEARASGRLPAYVGWGEQVRAVLVAADTPRDGWKETVSSLAAAGREVVVLTGDSEVASERYGAHPDVDRVFAGVPPDGKAATVRRLGRDRTVAVVGDGSNDAPALAAADIGIAVGDATALAVDAADAVVTTEDLAAVPRLFELTRATRRRVRENLAWAFGYNAVALPLALAGALTPLWAALAMAASSLLVVTNSSRTLLAGDIDSAGPGGGADRAAVLGGEQSVGPEDRTVPGEDEAPEGTAG